MSNPFSEDSFDGPRYGNAYEPEATHDHQAPSGHIQHQQLNNPYQQRHYSSGIYSSAYDNNVWGENETNKTEYSQPFAANNNAYEQSPSVSHNMPNNNNGNPQQQQQQQQQQQNQRLSENPYQYTGTRFGNQSQDYSTAYSAAVPPPPLLSPQQVPKAAGSPMRPISVDDGKVFHRPSNYRFWFRAAILLFSIGHLGFAAGAGPYSHQSVPFSSPSCFYYLFAVASISIVYSTWHIFSWCYRYTLEKPKTNRISMFFCDLVMAVLWGVGVIIEASKYKCTSGDKFCAFYNVSIFWGFLTFACYIIAVIWDVYGGFCAGKKRTP